MQAAFICTIMIPWVHCHHVQGIQQVPRLAGVIGEEGDGDLKVVILVHGPVVCSLPWLVPLPVSGGRGPVAHFWGRGPAYTGVCDLIKNRQMQTIGNTLHSQA